MTNRVHSAVVAEFLQNALAGDALGVAELEARALGGPLDLGEIPVRAAESDVVKFLRAALADGAHAVTKLEASAQTSENSPWPPHEHLHDIVTTRNN